MPLQWSTAQIVEKNRLNSDHVFTMLWEVNIPQAAGGALRLAMYDQPINFHGFTFEPTQMQVDAVEDATHASLVSLHASFQNIDQIFVALFEAYWISVPSPRWSVSQWMVDVTMPGEMPYGFANVYAVQQAVTDYYRASAELMLEGYTLTSVLPRNRYTKTGGFPFIPRRT